MSKHLNEPPEDGEATRHPNGRSGGLFMKFVIAVPVVALMAGGLVGVDAAVGPVPDASAHNGTLDAKEVCVDGKPAVQFSGTTNNVPAGVTADLKITQIQPAGATVSNVVPGYTLNGNTDYSFMLTVPEGTTYAQAVADLTWTDGAYDDPIGKANLTLDCSPDTEVVPAAPTATPADCENLTTTATPGSQPGVIWNPSTPTTLNPGESVTYTATPADDYAFPAGAQTSWTFTNTLNPEDCTTEVIVGVPTFSEPTCDNPNKVISSTSPVGVLWNQQLPYMLAPGESVTLIASPADGFEFPSGAQTTWTFTNGFDVKDCEEVPPSVGYAGSVSGDCTYGYGLASLDKKYDGRVKFTLWVGGDSKSFWVKPGESGRAKLKGEPGDRVRLVAEGKNIAIGHLKKNCDNPPPPSCTHDCTPPPPTECVGYDANNDGVVSSDECVPTTTADTGLGDIATDNRSSVGASQAAMLVGVGLLFGLFMLRRPTLAGLRRR